MTQNVFLIMNRCLGCEECVEACRRENRDSLCFVESYQGVPIPFRCVHCTDAPCEKVCPTEAITIRDGVVLVDNDKCIGCRYCEFVCPWGIPIYNEDTKKIMKCDMCYERQQKGKVPACVEVCPAKALVFGDLQEFEEEFNEKTSIRLEEVGIYAKRVVLPQEG